MRVSLSWLNDYVDISGLDATQVAAAFTNIGLEVEQIEAQASLGPEVVVGQILTAAPHPNADSLRLCTVDVGEGEPLTIVCGAPNARDGLKVVVAKVGAVLPGDFKIKKSKIRGEVSLGMMCSEKELELSEQHAGIIELQADAKVGSAAAQALGLDEAVLTLNVTPNRGDCLGVIGLARDLAAKLGRVLKKPTVTPPRAFAPAATAAVKVSIEDDQGCPRFVALSIDGVPSGASPTWMQKRLTAAGMRPISAIVDVTNYVMLEYGQPIHAYDARGVEGHMLVARAAKAGEILKTLDGQSRALEAGDLVIADRGQVLGLAGVMGGASSEVRADTSSILVEVAAFNGRRIRGTAKRLTLHSEASKRFERGTDADNLPTVAWRVYDLLCQCAAHLGQPQPAAVHDLVDCYPAELSRRVVAARLSQARQFLALPSLSKEDFIRHLEALEFDLLDSNEDRMVFEVPFFRPDIEREVDLIEEVGRLHGFEKVPYQLPVMNIRPTPEAPFIDFQDAVRTAVAALGWRETASFPMQGAAENKAMRLSAEHPLYPSLSLANPLNEQQDLLQTSLVPGLLRALVGNRRRGERGARLFEVGRGYFDGEAVKQRCEANHRLQALRGLGRPARHLSARARNEAQRPAERQWLAAVIDQPWQPTAWQSGEQAASFYHGKSLVVGLVAALGAGNAEFSPIIPELWPFLHPGAAALISLGGQKIAGFVGELHPEAAVAWDLADGGAPIVCELDVEALFDAKNKASRDSAEGSRELPRFPPVTRDLALVVRHETTHGALEQALWQCKQRRHLVRTNLFDVYTGPNLPAGKKSMAYTLTFQAPDRTLTDKEVEQEVAHVVAWLGETQGAVLR